MATYPITTPVTFNPSAPGDVVDFRADGYSSSNLNHVSNFVTSHPGDILYRQSTGTSNVLERLPIGVQGDVLFVPVTPTVQISTIATVADVANSLNGAYFIISSPSESFYIWLSTGTATDPGLPKAPLDLLSSNAKMTGYQVSFATNATAPTIATAISSVINGITDFSTSVLTNTVTVTNVSPGLSDTFSDGLVATGFTLATSTPGVSSAPQWGPVPLNTGLDSFLARITAAGNAIPAGAAWITVAPAYGTWDDTTLPSHDDDNIFNSATGTFTVPTSGVYSLSGGVSYEANSLGINGTIVGRHAIRQVRIMNLTTGVAVSFYERQPDPGPLNSTQLQLSSCNAKLTALDVIVLQTRHDSNKNLLLSINDGSVSAPSNYFSVYQIS